MPKWVFEKVHFPCPQTHTNLSAVGSSSLGPSGNQIKLSWPGQMRLGPG